jgi:hypothetical protein
LNSGPGQNQLDGRAAGLHSRNQLGKKYWWEFITAYNIGGNLIQNNGGNLIHNNGGYLIQDKVGTANGR